MSSEPLLYNYESEHFILPHNNSKLTASPKGTRIYDIGTVVLRDFRNVEKRDKDVKLDVYFIEYWKQERAWIRELRNGERYFTNALNSPDNFEPIFDCDAIKVFAENEYYFVDEKTGDKSLRCFNVRWHNYTRNHSCDKRYDTIISLDHYPCCGYFNSCGKNLRVMYKNGIPIKIERLEAV
jgi:hypothetical protein